MPDTSAFEKKLYGQNITTKYSTLASSTNYQDNDVSSEDLVNSLNTNLEKIN